MDNTTTTNPITAPEPFDGRDNADIILRSSDQYDFHVHKVVLVLASPFFKQMFSLSQPTDSSSSTPGAATEPLPIIPMTEDRDTIDYLLRLCYPVTDPTPPSDVKTVATILEAAMKYELEEARVILKALFARFIPTDPLQVYAHACRLLLEHEASEAAKRWREQILSKRGPRGRTMCQDATHTIDPPNVTPCYDYDCVFKVFQETALGSTWVNDMEGISAGCLYRMVRFMQTGKVTSFCDPPLSPIPIPESPPENATPLPVADPDMLKHCPADITLKSSDGKLIKTYRTFLAFAGASELLDRACAHLSPHDDPPVVEIGADEGTILRLLKFCEPLAADVVNSKIAPPGDLLRMWGVAQKYGMRKVVEAIRSNWAKHIEDDPLRSYFTARQCGWSVEAQKAATLSADFPLFDEAGYAPEMELVPATFIRDLYQFQHDHRRARAIVLERARANSGVHTAPVTSAVDPKSTTLPMVLVPLLSQHLSSKVGCSNRHNHPCCIRYHWSQSKEQNLIQRSNDLLRDIDAAISRVSPPFHFVPIYSQHAFIGSCGIPNAER